ncbi:alpha/beta fold hydrolase [Gordonia sp. NPDC003376]
MTDTSLAKHVLDAGESADRRASLPSGIELCYRESGNPDGPPIVLISGLMEDLTGWSVAFLDALAARGFRIIRLDNRDAGRSSRIDAPPPNNLQQFLSMARPDAYTLDDMAQDVVGLLDHLGLDRVHTVGRSMGGMIAQALAAEHPDRVLTLTSLYSTTGDPAVGKVAFSTKRKLMARPPATLEQYIEAALAMLDHLGGRGYPYDRETEIAHARISWERAQAAGPGAREAGARQIQAIAASGDRTPRLRTIRVPTLVINGDRDLIVHPSGGDATARAIPGATHIVIRGMGHHIAPDLVTRIADEITTQTRQGASS